MFHLLIFFLALSNTRTAEIECILLPAAKFIILKLQRSYNPIHEYKLGDEWELCEKDWL